MRRFYLYIFIFIIPFALNAILIDTTTVVPEYHDPEYYLDLYTAHYPYYLVDNEVWRDNYFLISGGCFDIQYIFTEEQLYLRVPLSKWLAWGMRWDAYYSMEYRYSKRWFFLEFSPYNRFVPVIILNPVFQKNMSDVGMGMRYRSDNLRFYFGFFIDNFDNNYSFKFRSDPFYPYYSVQPMAFRGYGRWFSEEEKNYLRWDFEITNKYQMDFFAKQIYLYSADSFYSVLKLEGLYHIKSIDLYGEFDWRVTDYSYNDTVDTDTIFYSSEDSYYNRIRTLLKSSYHLNKHFSIDGGIELYRTYYKDTVNDHDLERTFYTPILGGRYSWDNGIILGGEFVWFRGNSEDYSAVPFDSIEYKQTRFILTFQYNFKVGSILLRKGFELDKVDIENGGTYFFYDKGYIMFSVPLDNIIREDKK